MEIKYAAVEDVIIHKLIAGCPRDLEDFRLMLLKNQDVDFDYLSPWLNEFEKELGVGYRKELDKLKSSKGT